jgi:putative acetyltransferase
MTIRLDESNDWTAIYAVYEAAFGQSAEADLVRRLHADGDLLLSMTAHGPEPIGHIAFSRLLLNEAPSMRGCALAPLAVSPAAQGQGIGTRLVKEGLARMARAGLDLVIVLGEPDYYGRFGFDPKLARNFKTLYDGPYLQALALSDKGREAHGSVTYARAFAELK